MAASITLYHEFKKYLADGTIDLDTHTFKVMLTTSTYTPSAANHTVKADVTNELSTANGYTAGGEALGSVTWAETGAGTGVFKFDAADTVWTASGAGITARYAVIYDDTPTSPADPLVAYILLDTTPADVTVTAGNTLTLQWNASGILDLS